MTALTGPQISIFAILIVAFALLMTERLRNDIVVLLVILALYISGLLKADEALSGFGSEAAIVVAAIFVLSAALHQTGLSDMVGAWVGRLAGNSFSRAIGVIMPGVALLSAFTHHVTTTALMLPVVLDLSRARGIPAAKLLMPLSFAASLGTTITIIGAPAFLVATSALRQAGRPGLGIFSIAPIGLALSATGTLFVLTIGRFLLPSHEGAEDNAERFRLEGYFTELEILPGSSLEDRRIDELSSVVPLNLDVVGWLRDGRHQPRPYGGRTLRANDVLLVRTTPDELLTIQDHPGIQLRPVTEYKGRTRSDDAASEDLGDRLVQAVIAPTSDLAGRSIGQVDFRERFDILVVGLWRRTGWLQQELSKIKLRVGDVLVLQGGEAAINRLARDPSFLMLVPLQAEMRLRRKAPLAGLIMLATIVVASLNLLPLELATLAGAVGMVLTRCLTRRQAYRAIDARIYVFIAGAIPLGAAMQKSGASEVLARWLQAVVHGWSQFQVLLLLFAIVSIVTQFMSDAATTAVFAPVAVSLAAAFGRAPEPYVVTVAMAAVASFLTPIGHHGNLLVYGPGRYQFSDFVKVGTPLTVLVAVVVAAFAPVLWKG